MAQSYIDGWDPISARLAEISQQQHEGIGSGSRTRTYDPRINSPLLYQLSYAGVLFNSEGGGK